MNMYTTKRGFTLIELLVVIAIIGILSSVVLASLNSARLKSRDARRLSDIKQLQNALTLYFDKNTAYPPALADLAPDFISVIPQDPLSSPTNTINYLYIATGASNGATCTGYHLGATLEDSTNKALDNALHGDGTMTGCTGDTDFNGASPVYDVKN